MGRPGWMGHCQPCNVGFLLWARDTADVPKSQRMACLKKSVRNVCLYGVDAETSWKAVSLSGHRARSQGYRQENRQGTTEVRLGTLSPVPRGELSGGKAVALWKVFICLLACLLVLRQSHSVALAGPELAMSAG